jgi:hypothetical protein
MNKAKIELEGEEILAAADVLLWISSLDQKISHFVQLEENKAKMAQAAEKIEEPKKETTAIKPESLEEKPKKSKK